MAGFMKDSIAKLVKYFQEMEKGKKLRLIILSVLAVAVVLAASILLNQKSYTVLYSGMNAGDAGEAVAQPLRQRQSRLPEGCQHRFAHQPHLLVEDTFEQLFLRPEIVVQHGVRHAGRFGDRGRPRPRI